MSENAHRMYLANHPNNEMRTVFPLDEEAFIDADDDEGVSRDASDVVLRGCPTPLPGLDQYEANGILLVDSPRVRVFELCRYLAAVAREDVLATPRERRISVPPELDQILQLEEWHHPNVADPRCQPSGSPTFQQLARVLETGDVTQYRSPCGPNTHWRHWPSSGQL